LALHKLGTIHMYAGAFARSWGYFARALALAERFGDQLEIMFALGYRSEVLVLQGEWHAARRDLERAVDLGRTSNCWSVLLRHALLRLARLHLVEGEWAMAARCAEEWLPWAERTGDLPDIHGLLAERELLEGRPDAALARLTPLLDHPGTAPIELTPLLPLLAWAHLERGEDAAAAGVVARGIEQARAQHHRLALVDALRVQAMVATRQGCWAEAQQALEEGLALARGMPYPYAEARLVHVSGALHVQKGEAEPARERLEAALAIFRRLGARKDAESVEQALADLAQP
jgi:tetratricopeptide (TPR) repeat protein